MAGYYSLMFLFSVVLAICSLLLHPNADNPAVQEIADMYLKDREKFDATARLCTEQHARPYFKCTEQHARPYYK